MTNDQPLTDQEFADIRDFVDKYEPDNVSELNLRMYAEKLIVEVERLRAENVLRRHNHDTIHAELQRLRGVWSSELTLLIDLAESLKDPRPPSVGGGGAVADAQPALLPPTSNQPQQHITDWRVWSEAQKRALHPELTANNLLSLRVLLKLGYAATLTAEQCAILDNAFDDCGATVKLLRERLALTGAED